MDNKENDKVNLEKNETPKINWKVTLIVMAIIVISTFLVSALCPTWITISLFCAYFFLGGILVFKQSLEMGLMFTLIPLVVEAVNIYIALGFTLTNKTIAMGFGLLMIVFGILVMVVPYISSIRDRKRCTVPVNAVLESIDSRTTIQSRTSPHNSTNSSFRRVTYTSPVYKFYYKGKERTYQSNLGINFVKYHVGDECTLYINENDDEDIYCKEPFGAKIFTIVMGLFIITFGIMGITIGMYLL